MEIDKMKWKRTSMKGLIDKPLVEYLENLFDEELSKGYELKVCIGTDSQKSGKGYKFATAIVIETKECLGFDSLNNPTYVGRGSLVLGSTFWEEMKSSTTKKKHREIEILNQRMLKEVGISINVGWEISDLLNLYEIPLEIHADINSDPKYNSNSAMNEAIGYINAMGWESKIKPDAYAASTGADKLC